MKDKSKKQNNSAKSWVVIVLIVTFILSLLFSFISSIAVEKLSIIPAVFVLLGVILLGILFDLIGVAVTVANEEDFHAQASKKIQGAKTSIKMIRNSPKVSNFCADVIGDICGVLSGAISAMIAAELISGYNMNSSFQFVISALVASLTVGGKAITKEFAKIHSTQVVSFVSKIINIDKKK